MTMPAGSAQPAASHCRSGEMPAAAMPPQTQFSSDSGALKVPSRPARVASHSSRLDPLRGMASRLRSGEKKADEALISPTCAPSRQISMPFSVWRCSRPGMAGAKRLAHCASSKGSVAKDCPSNRVCPMLLSRPRERPSALNRISRLMPWPQRASSTAWPRLARVNGAEAPGRRVPSRLGGRLAWMPGVELGSGVLEGMGVLLGVRLAVAVAAGVWLLNGEAVTVSVAGTGLGAAAGRQPAKRLASASPNRNHRMRIFAMICTSPV